MRIRPVVALASIAALAAFATACEDPGAEGVTGKPPASKQPGKPDGDKHEEEEAQKPPSEPTGPEKSEQPDRPAGGVDADLGKTLKVGDSTLVNHAPSGSPRTTVKITVRSVKPGKLSDLENIRLDEKERRMTPYYVTTTFRYVDGAQPRVSSLTIHPKLRDGRGENAGTAWNARDDVSQCVNNRPEELSKGEDFTTCRVFLVAEGEEASMATYQTNFRADPVFWKVER